MAIITADDVQETSTDSGTGDLTLLGATAGNRAFSSVCADQDQFSYSIKDQAGGSYFESGIARYNLAANSITRLEVTASSNAGALVNLPAGTTKLIYITSLARQTKLVGAYPFTSASDGLMFRWNASYSRTDLVSLVYASKLYDISGNNRHSDTNATGPRWVPRGMLRGYPGIYFFGGRRLTVSALPGLGSPLVCTVLVVGQDFQIQTGNSHIYNWSGNPIGFGSNTPLDFQYNGTLPAAHSASSDSKGNMPSNWLGFPAIVQHIYNGASSVQRINAVEQTINPGTAATGTTNSFTIGGDSSTAGANFSKFLLWEIAVLSTALSAAKRAAYDAWVQAELEFRVS